MTRKHWLLGAVAVVAAAQLAPWGRDHTNPPVRREPAWDNARTRELAVRACFDCHSNQTEWPWYSSVAPVSWMTGGHVKEGREKLNFSEWDRPQHEATKAADVVRSGDMPEWPYMWAHKEARLSPEEKEALIAGLRATLAGSPQARQ
jgi:mono/diheme cytochrome c family protein